jgi:hypothetical protein
MKTNNRGSLNWNSTDITNEKNWTGPVFYNLKLEKKRTPKKPNFQVIEWHLINTRPLLVLTSSISASIVPMLDDLTGKQENREKRT